MLLEDRLARLLDPKFHLRAGSGRGINSEVDACMMQAVHWLAGGDGTRSIPECADRTIAQFCIRLNDASGFAEWRDELKPFVPRIVGTAGSRALSRRRAFMCADWAVRTITPLAFEFWAQTMPTHKDTAREWAQRLRNLARIVDAKTADAARSLAREA